VGAVQLACQCLQFGLGQQRVGDVVGDAHALGDGGAERIGQAVGDIAELVELAALDHRVVEHVGDRAAQGLGAVDHTQDRPGGVQATLAQACEQVTHHGGILGRAFGQSEGDLGAVDGDAERDHAGVAGDVDAVDQQADQIQA